MPPRKRFDPVVLFERSRSIGKYRSLKKELQAVADGEKALSAMSYLREHIESTEFLELLDQALRRGLTLVLSPDEATPRRKADQNIRVYVLSEREMWRVPAEKALLENAYAYGRWTDSLEAQTSSLYGYSKADIEKWMARVRWNQAGWGCLTIYTLLDASQCAYAEEYGFRMFGPVSSMEDREFFFHAHDLPLSPAARKRVPRGQTLARVGIDWQLAREWFAFPLPDKPAIATFKVTPTIARRFARAMRTNVQLLGADGWST